MKSKLEGHLKSTDFFEVEKFPTASYEITKVTEAKVVITILFLTEILP